MQEIDIDKMSDSPLKTALLARVDQEQAKYDELLSPAENKVYVLFQEQFSIDPIRKLVSEPDETFVGIFSTPELAKNMANKILELFKKHPEISEVINNGEINILFFIRPIFINSDDYKPNDKCYLNIGVF